MAKKGGKIYLGFDLGASSGRAVVGTIDRDGLVIEEIHRFTNEHIRLGGSIFWDFMALWKNFRESLRLCGRNGYNKLDGIGIDTWGVDFGLVCSDGKLVGRPLCYRDECTEGADKIIEEKIGKEKLYNITGIPLTRIASLPQLVAMKCSDSSIRFKIAKSFLLMPDLFRYFLCDNISVEKTIAGTTQLLNISTGKWSNTILKTFRIPGRIMPDIVDPGTITGKLKADLAQQYGLNEASVIAVVEHDTPSAFAAAPYADEDTVVISCGTWSVVGQSFAEPVLTDAAFESGFVNEPGFQSVLLVRNLMGLYLFENLKRELATLGQKISYSQMVSQAREVKPFENFLYANSPMFFAAKEPVGVVKEYLKKTGQKGAKTESVIRLLLEGLAFSYKSAIENLKGITGRDYKRICLVGGGVRNGLLCQMTADATGLEVIAGPGEATVTGNFAVQAFATGQLRDVEQIREMVRGSFSLKKYKPKQMELWNAMYDKYKRIEQKSVKL